MILEHCFERVDYETEKGNQVNVLKPEDAPKTAFCQGDDKAVTFMHIVIYMTFGKLKSENNQLPVAKAAGLKK
ncbi:MAG: hypothetical protein ACOX1F_00410 [Erysipelotrichaceae bacterium]|jgi:hypothetical protein